MIINRSFFISNLTDHRCYPATNFQVYFYLPVTHSDPVSNQSLI